MRIYRTAPRGMLKIEIGHHGFYVWHGALSYMNLQKNPNGGLLRLIVRIPRAPRFVTQRLCARRDHEVAYWLQGTASYACRCGARVIHDEDVQAGRAAITPKRQGWFLKGVNA